MRAARVLGLLLGALLAGGAAHAQAGASPAGATVDGRVTDAAGEGVPGASVFLAGTRLGAAADADGRYRLGPVPPGRYDLVASAVGFAPATVPVDLGAGDRRTVALQLASAPVPLREVTVTGDRRDERRNFERFRAAFLGRTPSAGATTIRNPEVLRFEPTTGGGLTARARVPLRIENRALGLRLTFVLDAFATDPGDRGSRWRGAALFEDLPPRDARERAAWADARRAAYRGSFRHFLRALAAGTTDDEGFRVYATEGLDLDVDPLGRVVSPEASLDALVTAGPRGVRRLRAGGYLQVLYVREGVAAAYYAATGQDVPEAEREREHQRSIVRLPRGVADFDADGVLRDPYAVTKYGYWAWEDRVSHLLPRDYTDAD